MSNPVSLVYIRLQEEIDDLVSEIERLLDCGQLPYKLQAKLSEKQRSLKLATQVNGELDLSG